MTSTVRTLSNAPILSPINPTKVGGIILDNNENLLLVFGKYSQKWGVPKGTLEDNETYIHGALREIKEETGLGLQHPNTAHLEYWSVNRARLYLLKVIETAPLLKPYDDGEIGHAIWLNLRNYQDLQLVKANANKMLLAILKKLSVILSFRY